LTENESLLIKKVFIEEKNCCINIFFTVRYNTHNYPCFTGDARGHGHQLYAFRICSLSSGYDYVLPGKVILWLEYVVIMALL